MEEISFESESEKTTDEDAPQPETNIFKKFDIVSDLSDHYYSKMPTQSGKVDSFTNVSSAVHKKIMKEWKILEKNLPDTILVRVYDTRVDLLQAVIVGAAGTPYHDGLFFFDLAFPPDYPNNPPSVNYRSYGLRINPNLYADGKVCLSLLNTWYGNKKEKWNPNESTVLQVLLSIQALVLNEKPYFNEPGTGMWLSLGAEKCSLRYSENAFVLSCNTITFTLRNPPRNFKAFVISHFQSRGLTILSACDAYSKGRVQIGFYRADGPGSSSRASVVNVSDKFKKLIKQVVPILVREFQKIEAPLGNFVEQLEGEKKQEEEKNMEAFQAVVRGKQENAVGKGKGLGKLINFLGLTSCFVKRRDL